MTLLKDRVLVSFQSPQQIFHFIRKTQLCSGLRATVMTSLRNALGSGWLWGIGISALILIGVATRTKWYEPGQKWVRTAISGNRRVSSLDSHDHGAGVGGENLHAHEGHAHGLDAGTSLALSAQRRATLVWHLNTCSRSSR